MVETFSFIAAKQGVEHDGTSMIVMNEGKETVAPAGARAMLEARGYLGAVADEPEAEPKADDDEGPEVPEGYAVNQKSGGWWEITGPDGFETVKGRGDDDLATALAGLPADDDAPAA